MATTQTSINVQYAGTTSSFTYGYPNQQVTILDSTNPSYLRQVNLRQNCVVIGRASAGIQVFIPLNQLFVAAGQVVPGITWPPVILNQPTSSTVTHPSPAYFAVSASAETPTNVRYQWMWQSSSLSTFVPCPISLFDGTASAALTCTATSVSVENSASLFCSCSNSSGLITTNVVNLYVL